MGDQNETIDRLLHAIFDRIYSRYPNIALRDVEKIVRMTVWTVFLAWLESLSVDDPRILAALHVALEKHESPRKTYVHRLARFVGRTCD